MVLDIDNFKFIKNGDECLNYFKDTIEIYYKDNAICFLKEENGAINIFNTELFNSYMVDALENVDIKLFENLDTIKKYVSFKIIERNNKEPLLAITVEKCDFNNIKKEAYIYNLNNNVNAEIFKETGRSAELELRYEIQDINNLYKNIEFRENRIGYEYRYFKDYNNWDESMWNAFWEYFFWGDFKEEDCFYIDYLNKKTDGVSTLALEKYCAYNNKVNLYNKIISKIFNNYKFL